jgi:tetratricopeptide (TPR) repeat protein
MLGKEKLNTLAPDADVYLLKFLDKSKSKNYGREVCLKLAHHYLIHGDKEKYDYYKNKINEFPKANTDRDREADVEMERPYPPHVDLLKAKYLVQGGYYHRAAQLLKSISKNSLNNQAYINEYDLYKAIIYANIQHPQEALKYCQKVINYGEYRSEHYASQAAFVAANIQLIEGNKQEAIDYLKLTKKINGQKDVYIEVIHKKATNMLNQLKKG